MRTGILLTIILLTSCSSDIFVFTDYDKDYDVRNYFTYRWSEIKNIENSRDPKYYNELNDKRIKAAVNKQLSEKGYKEISQTGDLVIHYHVLVTDMIAYREDPDFHHNAEWMRPEIAYYKYNEGTLIFDVMDLKTNSLVWRGYATQILDTVHPQLEEMKIDKAVAKIFLKFPERKK